MKLLLIDDDVVLMKALSRSLSAIGHQVRVCHDGEEALMAVEAWDADMVVLDVMLPNKDGLSVLREVREKYPDLPVIMLTARAEDIDKVVGLEMGADDYIAKPFSVRELEARIKAVSRRAAHVPKSQMRVGDLIIDLSGRRVWKSKAEILLSPREFDVLELLAKNRGTVFTREKMVEILWGYDYLGDSRAVDIQISRLREKIEDDPKKPKIVLTRRGVGYYIA